MALNNSAKKSICKFLFLCIVVFVCMVSTADVRFLISQEKIKKFFYKTCV